MLSFLFTNYILYLFLFFLIVGITLCFTSSDKATNFAILSSVFLFCYTLLQWFYLNPLTVKFSALTTISFFADWVLVFGLDGYSYLLVLLTTFIFSLCFFTVQQSIHQHVKSFLGLLFILEFLIIFAFLALDFLCFYILFEFSLIPMFLMIGFWGGNFRKTKAAYYLFLYTFFGSLFMLLAILFFFSAVGTTNYFALLTYSFTEETQKLLWPAIFFAFAIKVPMFPFHIWLPEAHVEAPTIGSVLLAALVLKLGGYGMLRFLFPLLPLGTSFYAPFGYTLALISSIYAAFAALRQVDLKRIIAYSSIAHMNVGLLGLFTQTLEGVGGFYYVMLGHGVISAALFFLVGVLYDRYHSRLFPYYSGLALRMPMFATFFFFFTVANVAFPGTFNFFAEALVLFSLTQQSLFLVSVTTISLFASTVYAFWVFNRACFGTLNTTATSFFYDLTKTEFCVFSTLTLIVLLGGITPNLIFGLIYSPTLFFLSF